ncbi:NAD(P)/FAD-dependent oxidoreductase [Phytoactinopolyspora alkaliphila]|uniref:NAD(P)/FAD-dependent oxidoreductase n=1 Tax=Phytoactinopolyspora alkaliphila TaxID=1783498 RepID=A0A6N9YT37_9ACTN|nr:NAD(P)/FAD-dependent oxidoreductase [Phytoactinopolyspora alkaliphila]
MNVPRYDVVIVGGRCAGAATATLLSRMGLRVLVLDRSRYGGDTVSTHALMRGGVMQLSRLGLLDAVVAAGTPPVHRAVFHYPEDTTRITLKPSAGVDALYAPRRTVLDPILVDAARQAGADVRFGVSVAGLLHDDDGRVTGVVAGDERGRPLTVRAGLVVGADGVRSGVARAVGSSAIWTADGSGSAVLYGYWDALPAEGYEWYYGPGGAAGLIPTNSGQTCVFVGTTPERMKAARAGGTWPGFWSVLDSLSPSLRERLAASRPPRRLHGFAGTPGFLRQSWGPGWVLIGDAGSFEDPLSTHGLTDALRDAVLVSEAIGEMRSGRLTEADALARYQATRDALALPLLRVVATIASFRWTLDDLRRLLRESSSAMSEQLEALHGDGPRELTHR